MHTSPDFTDDNNDPDVPDNSCLARIEELESEVAHLQKFMKAMVHDLREPLRTVLGFSQLVSKRINIPENEELVSEFVDLIGKGATRMHHIVSSLYDILLHKETDTTFEWVDCNALVKDVIDTLDHLLTERAVHISYTDLPGVFANPVMLSLIFQNLIQNSIKHATPASFVIKIHISVEDQGDSFVFRVMDNGIGIPDKKMETLFDFPEQDETEKGCGMGLQICKNLVEMHQGEIWVESEKGRSTSFYFRIPKDLEIQEVCSD